MVETPSAYTSLEGGTGPNRLLTFIINRIDKRAEEGRGETKNQ
jgi:hypothetical protein